MTTSVKVKACCPDGIQVQVSVNGVLHTTLQHGEEHELYVHDDREVSVREVAKE